MNIKIILRFLQVKYDMKISVISFGDKVTGSANYCGLLLTFIIAGNSKFQLEVNENEDAFFSQFKSQTTSKFMNPQRIPD